MSSDEFTRDPSPPADVPPSRRPPRFDAEPFRPDGVVPPAGLALFVGGLALTAVGLGFVLSFIGQWMYLIVIFPLLAGALLGGAGRGLALAGKVRSPIVAATIAALAGVGMMLTMHYFEYLHDLPVWQGPPPANVFEYIDLEAQEGVVVGEDGNNGFNLGYIGSYIYFIGEAALAAGLALGITQGAARTPFCRTCNGWKQPRTLAALPHVTKDVAVDALHAGALLDLLDTGTPTATSYGLNLKAYVCPRCKGDDTVVAVVEQVTTDSRGRRSVKSLGQYVYPGEVLALVDEYLPRPALRRRPRPAGPNDGKNPPDYRSEDIRPAP